MSPAGVTEGLERGDLEQSRRRVAAPSELGKRQADAGLRVEGGVLAEVDDLLSAVRAARRDPSLLAAERLRAATEESKLLVHRARLEHQLATRDAAIEALCVRHPRWIALKRALVAAIVPHREAALAVAEALRAFGIENEEIEV